MGTRLPELNGPLNGSGPVNFRNTQGDNLFNPPNPNATISNFNSGVHVQASLDDAAAVELAP